MTRKCFASVSHHIRRDNTSKSVLWSTRCSSTPSYFLNSSAVWLHTLDAKYRQLSVNIPNVSFNRRGFLTPYLSSYLFRWLSRRTTLATRINSLRWTKNAFLRQAEPKKTNKMPFWRLTGPGLPGPEAIRTKSLKFFANACYVSCDPGQTFEILSEHISSCLVTYNRGSSYKKNPSVTVLMVIIIRMIRIAGAGN